MLRAKIFKSGKEALLQKTYTGAVVKRWDVTNLQGGFIDNNGNETSLGRFLRRIVNYKLIGIQIMILKKNGTS